MPDLFDSARRVFWLKNVVLASLIGGLLLSYKLWIGPRSFPFAPPFTNLPPMPWPVEVTVFVLLVGSLAAAVFAPRPAPPIVAALALAASLALVDQMRWQPWFYQYFFMLAALASLSWHDADIGKRQAVLDACRLIVASIYFYSGLQKMNPVFMGDVFPWMIEPVAELFPPSLQIVPVSLGLVVPFLEVGIGLGLLTRRCRTLAIVLALLMLAFVLVTLGPLGHNWNSVVWPWNVAMVLFVLILFWRTDDILVRNVLWTKGWPFQKVILVLFGVMPAFSFVNLWDSYLSSTLYSGNTNRARIYISDSVKAKLPVELQHYTRSVDWNQNAFDFFTWSLDELNVPPYPETRVYKDIARRICTYATDDSDVVFIVQEKRTLLHRAPQTIYDCSNV